MVTVVLALHCLHIVDWWTFSVIAILDGHEQSNDGHFQICIHFVRIVLRFDGVHDHIVILILSPLLHVLCVFVDRPGMTLSAMLSHVSPRKELAVTVITLEGAFPTVFPAVMVFELTFESKPPPTATYLALDLEVLTSLNVLQQTSGVQDVAATEMAAVLGWNPNRLFLVDALRSRYFEHVDALDVVEGVERRSQIGQRIGFGHVLICHHWRIRIIDDMDGGD